MKRDLFHLLVALVASSTTTTHAATSKPAELKSRAIPPNDHDNYHYFAFQLRSSSSSSLPSNLPHYHEIRKRELHTRAQDIADSLDMHFIGRVGELNDYFQVAIPKSQAGSKVDEKSAIQALLSSNYGVDWADIQIPKKRLFSRSVISTESSINLGYDPGSGPPSSRFDSSVAKRSQAEDNFNYAVNELHMKDPEFKNQWHLVSILLLPTKWQLPKFS
jgi:hypothetical protein